MSKQGTLCSMLFPVRNTSTESAQRVENARIYLSQESFVCSPGRAAIRQNSIPLVTLPLAIETRDADNPNELPHFRHAEEMRFILRWSVRRLITQGKAGVVFVAEEEPNSHIDGIRRTWALWAELARVAHELSSGQLSSPCDFRLEAWAKMRASSTHDTIAVSKDDKALNFFLTTLSPSYQKETDLPHPRFAPHFAIGVVSKEAVAQLGDRLPAVSGSVMAKALARIKFPYNALLPYILPGYRNHFHPFAKKGLSVLAECASGVGNESFVPKEPLRFLSEFTAKAVADEQLHPESPANRLDGGRLYRVLSHLAHVGVIPTSFWRLIEGRFNPQGALPNTPSSDTGDKTAETRRRCPVTGLSFPKDM